VSRASVLARGRAFAATGFVDTCTITRVLATQTNPQTGEVTKSYTTIYSGACRVQASAGPASPADVGQAARHERQATLQVPVAGTSDIRIDDRATITACPNDPDLVGRFFHITGLLDASHKTARRLAMEELLA